MARAAAEVGVCQWVKRVASGDMNSTGMLMHMARTGVSPLHLAEVQSAQPEGAAAPWWKQGGLAVMPLPKNSSL